MKKSRGSLLRLRERLRQSTGPSRDIDHLLFDHVANGGPFRRYTENLDAALALVEEALPGSGWDVGSPSQPSGGQPWASVWPWGLSERREQNHRLGVTPPLAVLDALVSALLERLPPDLNLSSEMEGLAEAVLKPEEPGERPAAADQAGRR